MCTLAETYELPNYDFSSMPSGVYPSSFALPNVKCPTGWIPYHTSCYKMYPQPLSFDAANDQCKEGNLAKLF